MTAEEFNNLSEEEQQSELRKCESFEYFYNNYCRKEGMPEYSEKECQEYVKRGNNQRFSRRNLDSVFYPFTPEEVFKKAQQC